MKFNKYKPYLQAYHLDPTSVFFIGSQIFLKNPKFPQQKLQFSNYFSNKSPVKAKFIPTSTFNNFFNKKSQNFNKSFDKNDIESLENKGILTWESQISENPSENEYETSRNREIFLKTLSNLNKSDKTLNSGRMKAKKISQGGILRRKPEDKFGLITENSEKLLNFDQNSINEKTPKNNKNKFVSSPSKIKAKSISFSKSTSPLKSRKRVVNNEELQKNARKIQKFFREYLEKNRSINKSLNKAHQIIQHFPSYIISHFQKKLTQNFEKKQVNGSLLIVYYKRNGYLRVVFKHIGLKKVFPHIFDFSDLKDDKLRMSLFEEFLIKSLPNICIFNDYLTLKYFALYTQKTHKLKINKFILEEIELVSIQDTATKIKIPSLLNLLHIKLDDFGPLLTKEDHIMSNSSQTSIHPLINDYNNTQDRGDTDAIFPLINLIESLTDLSLVEPLLNQEDMTIINNDESQLEPILPEESLQRHSKEMTLNLLQGFEVIETISTDKKTNEDVSCNKNKNEELKEIVEKNKNDKPESKKMQSKEVLIKKLQNYFRSFLAKKRYVLTKLKESYLFKRFLMFKENIYLIDFRILSNTDQTLSLKIIFINKSDNSHRFDVRNSQETSNILTAIFRYPKPFVWIKFSCKDSKVFLKDPEQFHDALSNFEEAFLRIPKRLLFFGWSSLLFNNKTHDICNNIIKIEKVYIKNILISKKKHFIYLKKWSMSHDFLVSACKKLKNIFVDRKKRFWKSLNLKIKLKFQLKQQISLFSEKIKLSIEKIETKKGFLKSFKKVFLFSKFKDCEFLLNRLIYYKKKAVDVYCYFQPQKELLLIYTLSSEIEQYDEKINFSDEIRKIREFSNSSKPKILGFNHKTQESNIALNKEKSNTSPLSKPKTNSIDRSPGKIQYLGDSAFSFDINNSSHDFLEVEALDLNMKLQILQKKIKNITLIQSNSIKLRFQLYPEEYLSSALKIQAYLYKKLYYKAFEIKHLKTGKVAKAYILLNSNKIHLVLKNTPAFLSSIYEISEEMCFFVRVTKKTYAIEQFLSQGILYSPEKKEFFFQEQNISRTWLQKTFLIDGNIKKRLLLELDIKNRKLAIRIENEEKFYKLPLPEFESNDESSVEVLTEFIEKTLETTIILREIDGKLRILNDSDSYGPLMHKEDLPADFFLEKKTKGFVRLVNIKKTFQIIIEIPLAYKKVSRVTNTYISYENEDVKRFISDYLIQGIKENLTYISMKGIVVKEEFLGKDLEEFVKKYKGNLDSPGIKIIRKLSEEIALKSNDSDSPLIKINSPLIKKEQVKKDDSPKKRDDNLSPKKKDEIPNKKDDDLNIKKKKDKKYLMKNKKKDNLEEKEQKMEIDRKNKSVFIEKIDENIDLEGNFEKDEKLALTIQKKHRNKNKLQKFLEEDLQNYEKAAILIQKKFRSKFQKLGQSEGQILNEFKQNVNISNIKQNLQNSDPQKKNKYFIKNSEDLENQKNVTKEEIFIVDNLDYEKPHINPKILEEDIQEYEKAAVKIQARYRQKIAQKEENISPKTPNVEDSPPKPLMFFEIEDEKKNFQKPLESSNKDFQEAALKIQEKYREKHKNPSPPKVKSVKIESPLHKYNIEKIKKNECSKNRFSLPNKEGILNEGDSMEDSDNNLGLNRNPLRRSSFKQIKKNSLFSKYKGRTFELAKKDFLGQKEYEHVVRDENYRIRIFPAPEDLEIAVSYLQEWWREILTKRKWERKEGSQIESFLEDI